MFLKKSSSKINLVIVFSTKYSKIIFVLLDEVIAVHIGLIFVYIGSSDFKELFPRFVKIVLARILDFKTVLKLYCRLFSKYLGIKEVVRIGL